MSKYTFETSDLEEMRAVLAFVAERVRASGPAAHGARGEDSDVALWLESMPADSRRTIDTLVRHGHEGTTIKELTAELGVTPAKLGGWLGWPARRASELGIANPIRRAAGRISIRSEILTAIDAAKLTGNP